MTRADLDLAASRHVAVYDSIASDRIAALALLRFLGCDVDQPTAPMLGRFDAIADLPEHELLARAVRVADYAARSAAGDA